MSKAKWASVDRYISDLFIQKDPVLEAALAASKAGGLPPINVSATQGKLLMILAQAVQARRILEIGTLGAYSTIWLARGMARGGRLITLEAEPKHAAVARQNIARAGFGDAVELRLGRAIDTLPQLAAEKAGPFDFIFLDADKASYADYWPWCVKLARPGALVVSDNLVRKGAVVEAGSKDAAVRGVRKFNKLLAAEPRAASTIIQTVGVKGYDGFALTIIKP